jgi:hypothetical protein
MDEAAFSRGVIGFWNPSGTSGRIALIAAVLAGCAIFAAGSRWFGVPALPGFDGGLLLQPAPAAAIIEVAALLLVATVVGTVLAGAIHFEAGLFAATFAMLTLSGRCGTIQSVLLESAGRQRVYWILFLELLILSAIIAGLWFMLRLLGSAGLVGATRQSEAPKSEQKEETGLIDRLTAFAAQIVATGLIVMFLCQSEAKNQSLASVGIASIVGAMIACKYSPVRPSIWYWSGPLVVGLLGYLLVFTGQDAQLAVGNPSGTFAALARPLPMDYASVGPAGAMLGYWMMRKN